MGLRIDVVGLPAPKGSKKAFVVKGRAIVTDVSNKSSRDRLNPWKLAVTAAVQRALAEIGNPPPLDVPLDVHLLFWLPRPESTPKRVTLPAKKPDCDKLARAALDLCSKVVWTDDARIVNLHVCKRFAIGRPPGMTMNVGEFTE
jgi:crossover junction endodeoxyribonuclease RusA